MIKTVKFGGSSLATAERYYKVAETVLSDKDRKFIIVSAFGKRFSDDEKITDMLYRVYDCVKNGQSVEKAYGAVFTRTAEIVRGLKLNIDLTDFFDKIERETEKNFTLDFVLSRGEYISARVTAEFLKFDFIDAKDIIKFNDDGTYNGEFSEFLIRNTLSGIERAVIPGFYGETAGGVIKTFGRGGSDFTGSVIAGAVKADIYENFTDVSGIFACDPKIAFDAEIIKRMPFSAFRRLSEFGASVLHPDSVLPLKNTDISINVKNTFRPEDKGTFVIPDNKFNDYKIETAVTAKSGVGEITILKYNKTEKYDKNLLDYICGKVSIINVLSSADRLAVSFFGSAGEIAEYIYENYVPDSVNSRDSLALIYVMCIEAEAKISEICGILQSRNISVRNVFCRKEDYGLFIIVADSDKSEAVKAIYAFERKKI